jgi:putative DNA primase/helicase
MERPRHAPEMAGSRPAPAPNDGRPLALWRKAVPIDCTPAEHYLRARGFAPPHPATLRYLPALDDHPHAMLAALGLPDEPEPGFLRIPDAAVRAVHLTRLDATRMRRFKTEDARIVVGRTGLGFPVALTPIGDGLGLLITEGIENALSLGSSLGLGAWAACSHTRMPALAENVPAYVDAVTVVADPEVAARASASTPAQKLERRGSLVSLKVFGEVA